MKHFITRNHLRWLSRRCKRLIRWAVLHVLVDEIFLLQPAILRWMSVFSFSVQPCGFLLGDESSSLHLWSYFVPVQQLPTTSDYETEWAMILWPVHSMLLLFLALLRRGQSMLWSSKLLPGFLLRNLRSCCKLSLISRFLYSYLAHIFAWHPKLTLSNLQPSQLKTSSLPPLSPASSQPTCTEVWAWFAAGDGVAIWLLLLYQQVGTMEVTICCH